MVMIFFAVKIVTGASDFWPRLLPMVVFDLALGQGERRRGEERQPTEGGVRGSGSGFGS